MNNRSFNTPPAAIRTMTAAMNNLTSDVVPYEWRDHPEDYPVSDIFDQVMHAMLCWHERNDTIEGVHALGHVMAWAGIGLDLISQDDLIDDRPGVSKRKSRDTLEKTVEQLIGKTNKLLDIRKEMRKEIDHLREALARKDEDPIPTNPYDRTGDPDRKTEYENICRAAISLGEVNPDKGAPGIMHTTEMARAARRKPIVDDGERTYYNTMDRAVQQSGWHQCECGMSWPKDDVCRNPECDLEGVDPVVLKQDEALAKLQGGWRFCEGCGNKTPRVSQCENAGCVFHHIPVQICKHYTCGFVGPDVCWKEHPSLEQGEMAVRCERWHTHMVGIEED